MSKNIESHLNEERVFKPSKEFSKKARIKSMAQYKRMYRESIDKPGVFWAREAKELVWQKKMDQDPRLEGSLRKVVCGR
jgi:acetyl-CoA synthetase